MAQTKSLKNKILKIAISFFLLIGIAFLTLSLYLYFTPIGETDSEGIFFQAKQKYSDDKKFEDIYLYGLGFIKRVDEDNGSHHIRLEYDKNRNITEYRNYDRDGDIILELPDQNIAYSRLTYDDNKRATKFEFFNSDGNLAPTQSGYAIIKIDRSPDGDILENGFYGTDGKAILQEGGWTIKRNEYDENRNRIKESYFDNNDQLVNAYEGYAIKTMEYNENNEVINTTYYNKDNEVIEIKEIK